MLGIQFRGHFNQCDHSVLSTSSPPRNISTYCQGPHSSLKVLSFFSVLGKVPSRLTPTIFLQCARDQVWKWLVLISEFSMSNSALTTQPMMRNLSSPFKRAEIQERQEQNTQYYLACNRIVRLQLVIAFLLIFKQKGQKTGHFFLQNILI